MNTHESKAVRDARITARARSRESGRRYCQILDDIARAGGYGTWKAMCLANPAALAEGVVEWKARIRYAAPVPDTVRHAYASTAIDEALEQGDLVCRDIVWGLQHACPSSIVWKDDRTVEFGALHRHHALGVLACLPHRHLVEAGARLEIEHDGTVQEVPVAPLLELPMREIGSRPDPRLDGMVFRSDYEERPVWDEPHQDLVSSTTWDWLLALAGPNDSGYVAELVDELRASLDGAPFGYMVLKAHAPSYAGVIHPEVPSSYDEILDGWEQMPFVSWGAPIPRLDTTLRVAVTPKGASYVYRGQDYCLHAEETGDAGDRSAALARFRLSLWWRNDPHDPHRTGPMAMHQRMAGTGLWTGRDDDRVFEQLVNMRVLGEIPESERPLLVEPSMTRGVALMGEYPA